ncbi:MAG: thymidylate synthase [Gemmatimonadetes bacterium]|nr:thymidylate synthase [Gemmatimonadota bacterium]
MNVAFAIADLVWIMSGRSDLKFLKYWNRELPRFVGEGPELHGAYGHRLREHLTLDQLKRAYEALGANPETRQIVLQVWDSDIDLPNPDGTPVNQDIPCNVASLLKVRGDRLEWTQIMRSNDVFRGLPYNFVQFTCLQEIIAGWLGIECGSYNQVSDSLHVYEHEMEDVIKSTESSDGTVNPDCLSLPLHQSKLLFAEMENRIDRMIEPTISAAEIESLAAWDEAPMAYRNMMSVLVATALHRNDQRKKAERIISGCTNPIYARLWNGRFRRKNRG